MIKILAIKDLKALKRLAYTLNIGGNKQDALVITELTIEEAKSKMELLGMSGLVERCSENGYKFYRKIYSKPNENLDMDYLRLQKYSAKNLIILGVI